MWRTRAVLALLHEEIAGLPNAGESDDERDESLARARRRGVIVVALDWAAILVLVLAGERGSMLTLGPGVQTAFTLAILAVAVHSGFRLGQLDKLRAVRRAGARLAERDPDL